MGGDGIRGGCRGTGRAAPRDLGGGGRIFAGERADGENHRLCHLPVHPSPLCLLLLGAASATGVDIDPKAEDIARANAAMNGLTGEKFQAVTADVLADRGQMDALSAGGYEIVLANIVVDVIIPLSAVVPQFLRPGGLFLCSGILDRRLEEVQAAIGAAGLEILQVRTMEDWCQITARKV